ncbi:MAG TPA: carboxymuconolactone decarboxylase family protein [Acidimicrobiales bacterium]|jgi:alkylhydroperoxidase family enzyme|nr:carboxymuconolactone decarboxylase family protein [Acidimicrobiales bacterium]
MSTTEPRIPPLPPTEWDESLSRLLARSPGGLEEPMHIFTTLARQPGLFRRWLGFGGALLGGQLSGRLRELVILRVAFRCEAPYEWSHHVRLGAAEGVTPEEMAALGGELSDVTWDRFERAILAAVDETADQGAVGDETWDRIAGRLDSGDLVELVMLIGHYLMLSTVLRSLRVPIEPSAVRDAERVQGGPSGRTGPQPSDDDPPGSDGADSPSISVTPWSRPAVYPPSTGRA